MSGFSTCDNKGFHINFPNGLTLSTQFGGGNYGSNRNREIGDRRDHHAETVEIAIFPTNSAEPGSHHWVTQEIATKAGLDDPQDSVMGYVSFEDWLKLFDATRAYARQPAQVNAEREPHESRTEEDKREDDMDRQRAYPERGPR